MHYTQYVHEHDNIIRVAAICIYTRAAAHTADQRKAVIMAWHDDSHCYNGIIMAMAAWLTHIYIAYYYSRL